MKNKKAILSVGFGVIIEFIIYFLYISQWWGSDEYSKMPWLYIAICIFLTLSTICIFYFKDIKKFKIEKIFLITAILYGIMYMFLMSPLTVPDENAHFGTAYRWSDIIMGKDNGALYLIRECDKDIFKYNNLDDNLSSEKTKYPYISKNTTRETIRDLVNSPDDLQTNLVEEGGGNYDGGYVYWISALGIVVARFLGLSPIMLFYFARTFNFIFFVILTYFAIRKIPIGKASIFVIAMLPMTAHLAASVSYDGIICSIAFIFIAYVLAICCDETMKIKDFIIVCISGMLLFSAKSGVYAPLLLLFLIIPAKKIGDKFAYFKYLVIFGITSIIGFIICNFSRVYQLLIGEKSAIGNRVSFETYPISFIFTNFDDFSRMILKTISDKFEFYIDTIFGNILGYFETNSTVIIMPIIYGFMIVLLLSVINHEEKEINFNIVQKSIMIVASIISTFLVVLAMFSIATTKGFDYIYGIQGRYFLPIVPVVVLLLRNKTIISKKNLEGSIITATVMLQFVTIINILVNIFQK